MAMVRDRQEDPTAAPGWYQCEVATGWWLRTILVPSED
jgi:hypothetical protein